ncbi:hypothetical protein N2152v2_011097 [Parachlorella kessleri]
MSYLSAGYRLEGALLQVDQLKQNAGTRKTLDRNHDDRLTVLEKTAAGLVSRLERLENEIANLWQRQQPQQWRGPGKPLRQHWDMVRLLHVLQRPGVEPGVPARAPHAESLSGAGIPGRGPVLPIELDRVKQILLDSCLSRTEALDKNALARGLLPHLPPEDRGLKLQYVIGVDGTLTVSNIDFVDMRARTGIPAGDLFTVMESWDDGDRIKQSMDVILELEAKAATELQIQPGLLEVLAFLRDNKVQVGLVTRNTEASVDAFFNIIGQEWHSLFSPVLTRQFQYVKPDKRALTHFAEAWGLPPARLLMVGDSTEDVETGNAAGTATCLIAGGGNEVVQATPPAAPATSASPINIVSSSTGSSSSSSSGGCAGEPEVPIPAPVVTPILPPGAVPSFTVHSLWELLERLQAADTPLGWRTTLRSYSSSDEDEGSGAGGSVGWGNWAGSAGPQQQQQQEVVVVAAGTVAEVSAASHPAARPGAPPPGIDFLDFLFTSGAVRGARCSFPRVQEPYDGTQFGLPPDTHPGDRLLHFGCGDAGLTKLLASSGLDVLAADLDVSAAQRRGLRAAPLPQPLSCDSLLTALGLLSGEGFDAVVVFGAVNERAAVDNAGLAEEWWQPNILQALAALRQPSGRLCVECWVASPSQLRKAVEDAGLQITAWQNLTTSPRGGQRVHFDCKYKGIDAVSSRAARTLGGNRTVAEPYEFIAAGEVSNKGRKIQDSAGGLFAGGGGPKPPPALSTAVIGMKAGGKRTVKVPPELGYGDRGEQEIPPGATFDLLIEVLRVGE